MLAEVAETHQQSQEQGQWQRHGYGGDGGVKQQLGYNLEFQSFTYQVVDIEPYELHHPDKHHDEEGEYKGAQKRFGDITVKFLHLKNKRCKGRKILSLQKIYMRYEST